MRFQLSELLKSDLKAQKIIAKRFKNGFKEVDKVIYSWSLVLVLKVILNKVYEPLSQQSFILSWIRLKNL